MRKKGLIIVLLGFLLVGPVQAIGPGEANGLTATSSARLEIIQALREQIEARHEAVATRLENQAETIQNRIDQRTRVRIRNLYQLMRQRLTAAITRLEKIAARLESRLTQIENPDESVQPLLDEALAKLAEAKEALLVTDEAIEDVLESSEPLDDYQEVKEFIREIRLLLVDVHQLLQEALMLTKNQVRTATLEATESATN